MSQSLVRTRAEEDAADLVLRQSTLPALQSAATPAAPRTPSASSAMDSMWSEYEQYLQAARAAQEAGIDIFPQPAFVVKVSLVQEGRKGPPAVARKDLLEEDERGDSESDKLFINVCTDSCVDAPEIVNQPSEVSPPSASAVSSASSSTSTAAPPGSLRLPMSVGPLTPCTSRSGSPSLSVDVVIHPSTLAQPLDDTHSQAAYQYAVAQAAIIQRQSGKAPPVLTPSQHQSMAMRELKRTVAAFALQRIEEKYKLRVDEAAEVRFPKAAYKGSLPPPGQRIRRNKDNPLHAMTPQQREQAERRGKGTVLVQEVTQPLQSKPAALTAAVTTVPVRAAVASAVETSQALAAGQSSETSTPDAQLHGDEAVESERREKVSDAATQQKEEVRTVEPSVVVAERTTIMQEVAAVTPAYTLDMDSGKLSLQVQLPGVVGAFSLSRLALWYVCIWFGSQRSFLC